ncbi:MAG TPA: PAS domain S-box protein [Polyangiales bacterium]|nr:PAS domain S-box protein [Polyangiales bacterium]
MADSDKRLSTAILWLGGAAGALAVLGLIGHLFGIEWLVAGAPGDAHMQLSVCVFVLLAAIGVALQRGEPPPRRQLVIAQVLGAVVVVYGVVLELEYVWDVDLGLDWYPPSLAPLEPDAGRPSPFTGLGLAAIGGALLLRAGERKLTAAAREALCLCGALISFTSLVAHVFGAATLYKLWGAHFVGISLPTGIALGVLSTGAWLARPQFGLLRLASSPGPGGALLRQLGLVALIAAPLLVGAFLAVVDAIGLSEMPRVLAVGCVLAAVCAVALLAASAVPIERSAAASEWNRARAQQLLEQAPLGVFIADLSGRYIDVNAAGCKLLGFTREEILSRSIVDLLPEEEVSRLWEARDQMLQGAMHVAEWQLRRKDGSFVPVEATAKVLPDGRWQAFVYDTTERRELERRLLESKDFLERVLESSTEYAIVAEDLSGHIVLWNEGARRTYGYESDEIQGKPSDLLVSPVQLPEWTALRSRGLGQGRAGGNVIARRKDGTTFAANIVCTRRLGPDSTTAGVLLVMRDLTLEQRYLAEQEFLSRVGVELAACLDYRETLSRVTQLATSFLGDLVTIDVVQENAFSRVAARGVAGAQELATDLARLGTPVGHGHPLATVLQTKQPLLLAHISALDRKFFGASPEHARVLEQVNATSAMIVPLIARGQLLAVLSIAARDGSRTYGPDDLRLAMELARRAALTLDNVQLLQQSRLQGAVTTNLGEAVVLVRTMDSAIVYANPRAESMFGVAPHALLGLPMAALHAQRGVLAMPVAEIAEQLGRGDAWHGELECVRRDGKQFWCSVSVSNFDHDQHGRVWIALYTDITERKRLEEQSARALSEKEVLLKEIHHRVKNNLQVISSLFSLQRERTQSPELRSLFEESRARITSIALVHDQLYRSADLAAIDFDEYLRSLMDAIRSSYGAQRVVLRVSARNVLLEIDQAVPCALLVCELVSNSLRHAFPEGAGTVWVRAERDAEGYCVLEVGDDGRGLPPDLDWTKARSLGLKLVYSLARQLRAAVSVDRTHGTCFRLRFPSAHTKQRVVAASA